MTRPILYLLISTIVCLLCCVASPGRGVEILFQETFDTDVASTTAFGNQYSAFTADRFPGTGLDPLGDDVVSVMNGVLTIEHGTPFQGSSMATRVTIPGYSQEVIISADIGAMNSDGFYNVGMWVGENYIAFHPGFGGGALRVRPPEGGGFNNRDMGFTPANRVLHHMEVHQFPTGDFDIKVTDGANPDNVFTASWTNAASVGQPVGLQRSGPEGNDPDNPFGFYDNFTVSVPPSCDFNSDELCNVDDINLMFMQGDLVAGVADPDGSSEFNLNSDASIDGQDIDRWLELTADKNGYGTAPFLRGDTDDLGNISPALRDVDLTDFNTLSNNFAPEGTASGIFSKNWHQGNFDGDKDVDLTDFNSLSGNFIPDGYGAGQVGAAPEPTTGLLFAVGGLFMTAAASARWRDRMAEV